MNENLPDNPQIQVLKSGTSGLFTNYIYKAIPLAFDESMSYYETLCGLLNYLKNVVIPTVNNNADAVAELQSLYEQLRTYVDDYFTNLDVQDEINNKLDEMVEDGTLPEIVASYLETKAVFGFDTVNDMKNATNLINGSYAETLGYYGKGDGGSALYKIRTITNEDIVDETFIYALTNSNDLIAELIPNINNNVLQYGIKGDNLTDNYSKLNIILDKGIKSLYFPDGTYIINNKLIVNNCKTIKGQSQANTIIKANNGFIEWNSKNTYRLIQDLTISGNDTENTIGIDGTMQYCKLENLTITHFYKGVNAKDNSWVSNYHNLSINNCNTGFQGNNAFNNILFESCYFVSNVDGFKLGFGTNIEFLSCNFESNSNYAISHPNKDFVISNCYFEGNNGILNLSSSWTSGNVTIKNSRLYSNSNATSGWLALLQIVQYETNTASLIIEKSNIINNSDDNAKLFAFNNPNNYSVCYVGVSMINNYYTNIVSTRKQLVFYDDLFDKSNYGAFQNAYYKTPYTTDLPLTYFNGVTFFKKSLGNLLGLSKSNDLYKIIGTYEITSTGVQDLNITIPSSQRYACILSNSIPMICTVKYTDGTLENHRFIISASNIYIYNLNTSKTTSEIYFNNEYYGINLNGQISNT